MLIVVLALLTLLPGQSAATPPEGVSGQMVLDEVADGLRRFRREKDEKKRFGCSCCFDTSGHLG
jgi:hypothetical protein